MPAMLGEQKTKIKLASRGCRRADRRHKCLPMHGLAPPS
jgi:hypothetical protein